MNPLISPSGSLGDSYSPRPDGTPRITEACRESLRLHADIVALANDYTALQQIGTKWRGHSPFHPDPVPSFYVDADKRLFMCFQTNQGGDIFTLVMRMEGLSLFRAIEHVARRFQRPLEYEVP